MRQGTQGGASVNYKLDDEGCRTLFDPTWVARLLRRGPGQRLMGDVFEVEPATRPNRSIDIERVSTLDGLLELEAEWRELFEASGLDLFNSWEWQVPWWRHLSRGRKLWVLVARDEAGCAVGIVPMSLGSTRVGFLPVRRLGFLGDERVGSDYLDVIAASSWRPLVIGAAAGYLAAHADDWDLIEWRDMDARSVSAWELAAGLGYDHAIECQSMVSCPGQRFAPDDTFEEYLRRTRRCSNYLRRRRWLERQPGFRIDVCEGEPGLEEAREIFFRLHARRWAEDGGSAGIPDEAVRAFHVETTRRLAERGQVIFYTLWVDGNPVASVYGLASTDTFYYYQSGMDPAWRSKSVGLVLVGETFADAFRRNIHRYDFLRGEEAYKSDWVGEHRQLVRWRIYSRKGRGRWACRIDAGIRAARRRVKSWIGPSVQTLIRKFLN